MKEELRKENQKTRCFFLSWKSLMIQRTSVLLISALVLCAVLAPNVKCYADEGWGMKEFLTGEETIENEMNARIESMIEPYIGSTIQGAAVAVVKDDEILYAKGFGYADQKQKRSVDPQSTLFEYGSVSKLFIWTAVMQLEEQGKLDLNQDIRQYLTEAMRQKLKYKDSITMLDLMNHTAGFDDYIIGLFSEKDNLIGLKQWIEQTDVRQYMKPGEQCVYSNYGAALAAYIVEQVSGMEFRDYIKEFVYQKAGLEQIYPDSVLPDEVLENKSKAYQKTGSGLKEAKATYVSAYPAGGMNGTVEELAGFALALLQDHSPLFLKDSTRDTLFETSWLPEHGVTGTGMSHGFFQYPSEKLVLWHNGETMNFSSFFLLIPDEKFAVCIVCNTGGEDVLNAERKIAFSFVPEWNAAAEDELPDMDSLAGRYRSLRRCHHGITQLFYLLSPFDKMVTVNQNGTITVAGEVYRQVMPYVFYCRESGRSLCFQTDSQGSITGMHQLVGYEKISEAAYLMCMIRIGLLVITLFVILVYGILKKGWFGRVAFFLLLLVANIAVIAWRAMQLCFFRSLTVWMAGNMVLTASILIMMALQIRGGQGKQQEQEQKKERKKAKENEKHWGMILLFNSLVIIFLILLGSFGIYKITG